MRNGEVSYWWHALGGFLPRRASLPGPLEADVCIVGGGYTGLWTAYYLAGLRPGARIVVLEAAFAGYGASGRNGGWGTAELPGSRGRYARGPGGADGVRALGGAPAGGPAAGGRWRAPGGRRWTRSAGWRRPSRSSATSPAAGGCPSRPRPPSLRG